MKVKLPLDSSAEESSWIVAQDNCENNYNKKTISNVHENRKIPFQKCFLLGYFFTKNGYKF